MAAEESEEGESAPATTSQSPRSDIASHRRRKSDQGAFTAEDAARSESLRRMAGRIAHIGGWVLSVADGRMEWSEETRAILEATDDAPPSLDRGLDLHHGGSRAAIEEALRACREEGTPFDIEVAITTERGNQRTIRVLGEPSADANGVIDEIHGAVQDVTELRRVSAAAHEAAERLVATLDTIDDGFAHIDVDWRFTYVNRRAEAIVGRSSSELRQGTIWEVFPGLEGSQFGVEYHRAMRTQQTTRFEAFYPPIDKWIEVDAYPSADGLTIYFRDVTARRQAQDELALLHTTISHLPDAFVIGAYPVADGGAEASVEDSRLVFVNRSFAERAGLPADQLIGLPIRNLFSRGSSSKARAWVANALKERRSARAEFLTNEG